MPKVFRPSNRESNILSKIESQKEFEKRTALRTARDEIEALSNAVAMKLVETHLVETVNKNSLEEQIHHCVERLTRMDDFDIDYKIAPFRTLVDNPHIVSIFLTAFVIEELIDHRDTVDVFGSDEEIYCAIHSQVTKLLPV